MRIIHSVRDVKKEGEGKGSFLLSDRRGGYLCLPNEEDNYSNYQGWVTFMPGDWTLFKTIENIYLEREVGTVHNKFSHVERDSGGATERFFLGKRSLIYEVFNYQGFVNIDLDFRSIFDFSDQGRVFELYPREGGVLVVKYTKFRTENLSEVEYERYMAIKNVQDYWITGDWKHKCYLYDKERNSRCEFYVYGTLKVSVRKDTRMVFSHAATEEEAVREVNAASSEENYIMNSLERRAADELREKSLALNAAMNSLNSLVVKTKDKDRRHGVFAGYPWFFQFWARDEIISSKALMLMENYFLVKQILMDYFSRIRDDGWLPNKNVDPDLESADAVGLLFLRLHEFIDILREEKKLYDYFTGEEIIRIYESLEVSLERIETHHMKKGFVHNNKMETWMDTDYKDDCREGARIEIQAFHLRMMKFGSSLAKLLKRPDKFTEKEQVFREKVREEFYSGGELADGLNDPTWSPNIFLAHYAYPGLLSGEEWRKVFDNALDALWLDWGGLSTIDKSNELFVDEYTGETNESYHRGDSWFFINHIAGICMKRLDGERYKDYIEKIRSASEEELLFSGFLGHSAELSPAGKLKSRGCGCQAWSSATFIEFIH